uniref:Bradykinin-potentiating peptide 11f n=1 Tax=Bothrops cotiara TaxID=8727 RepID=BPPBF_BOTCO|nr:RecName: Full=Bradykinin-potentiating peptide 11f; Short=BPP-11f [Bothrops cotiara]
QNAHPSPKVPP